MILLADNDYSPPLPGIIRPVKLEIGTAAGATTLQTAGGRDPLDLGVGRGGRGTRLRESPAHFIRARFLQKFARLSVPPNKVVKMVESASRMSPARPGAGGIQIKQLNSV